MKISIYELLGMVKDGTAPKKIKWGDTKYTLYIDEDTKQKYYQDDECRYFFLSIKCLNNLNDEVEILEEEKKIPEKLEDILKVDDLIPPVDENMYKIWAQTIKNQNKINEICDYLKSKGE